MTLFSFRRIARPVPIQLVTALVAIHCFVIPAPCQSTMASDRDTYGGWPQVQGRNTGFFHVGEIHGRWWFITPDGNSFFSKGVNSANLDDGEERTSKPDAEAVAQWADGAARQLRAWGLNTAGCWSAPELGAHGIAYCFRPHLTEARQGEWPDVFDPRWVDEVNKRAMDQCGKLKSDPWLVGYFTDNELPWEHEDNAQEVLRQFLAMPAGSPGRQKAQSFDRKPGKSAADDFRHEVAIAYFRTTAQAIRAADPNHLILGCRFAGHPPKSVVRAMKGYVDVISLNNYSAKPPVDLLREMHVATGLPVMVTEWSVKGKDSGQLTSRGSGPVVANQRERAAEYEKYVEELAGLSYCVGFHWFRHRDHPGNNQGLLKANDQPWTELIAAFTALNPTLDERHAR